MKGITGVAIPGSVISIGNNAFRGNKLSNIIIPESVITIGYGAFEDNQLTAVSIPNSVYSIGREAFACNQLTRAILGNNVRTIGIGAFASYQIEVAWGPYSYGSELYGSEAKTKNQLTHVTIPNSVIAIEDWAFAGNQLTSVSIPDNVKSIGDCAFYRNQLISVTIGNGVTTIGECAFCYNKLTSIIIPNSVSTIEAAAFQENPLSKISISADVMLIADNRTGDPPFGDMNPPFDKRVFYMYLENDRKERVYVYKNQDWIDESVYHSNNYFVEKDFGFLISDDGNTVSIIEYKGTDTNVRIPEKMNGLPVTEIGHSVFFNKGLTDVTIPNSVTSIKGWAFANNRLTDIALPENLLFMGREAFANNQLTGITIPNCMKTLGLTAFHTNEISSITIGANVELYDGYGYWMKHQLDRSFIDFYDENGSKAGTYIFEMPEWKMK
jgi:hypothetical protein